MILYLIFFSASLFASNSPEILLDIYSKDRWEFVERASHNNNVFETKNTLNHDKYIMIEHSIKHDKNKILNVVKSIPEYNEIISNKNVTTELLYNDNDTLYCLQTIQNSVPFIRDRQYIFKLYQVNEDRIDWYLIDKEHSLLSDYLNDDIHTLTYGAGSWEIIDKNNQKVLIYRMYVDEEVNLPLVFIQKLRINHALDIFNDVLAWAKGVG